MTTAAGIHGITWRKSFVTVSLLVTPTLYHCTAYQDPQGWCTNATHQLWADHATLARILTPLAGRNGYTVKNTATFVERAREAQTTPQLGPHD